MKWLRQYEGPFLVIEKPSRLTAKIQRTAKAKPKVVRKFVTKLTWITVRT